MIKNPIDIRRELERARQAVSQFDQIAAPTTASEQLTRNLLRRGLVNSLAESVTEHLKATLGRDNPEPLNLASLCDFESA
jgi:hypothetical protein